MCSTLSGAEAVEAFAERVSASAKVTHLFVVNNAIGRAGRFLDTPAEQFRPGAGRRLGGVVNQLPRFLGSV